MDFRNIIFRQKYSEAYDDFYNSIYNNNVDSNTYINNILLISELADIYADIYAMNFLAIKQRLIGNINITTDIIIKEIIDGSNEIAKINADYQINNIVLEKIKKI